MRVVFLRVTFALAIGLTLSAAHAAYTYTLIAQAGGFAVGPASAQPGPEIQNFNSGLAVLNDVGVVAFEANANGGSRGDTIFAGNGRPLTTVASGNLAPNTLFDINNPSMVTYQNGNGDIVRSGAANPTIIYPNAGGLVPNGTQNFPSINDAGYVAFAHGGVIAYGNGVTTTDVGGQGLLPLISNSNQVVYVDNTSTPSVLRTNGSKLLVAQTPAAYDINRVGNVAYVLGTTVHLINADGTGDHVIVDAGAQNAYDQVQSISVNDSGDVVFGALKGIGGKNLEGFYFGPDPMTDRVIQDGDPLLGSTVTHLFIDSLNRHFNNDMGSVAFVAQLADGRQVVVRADPIPEPAAGLLLLTPLLALRRRRVAA